MAQQIVSGRVLVEHHAHEPEAPFGGFKALSGVGRRDGRVGNSRAFMEPIVDWVAKTCPVALRLPGLHHPTGQDKCSAIGTTLRSLPKHRSSYPVFSPQHHYGETIMIAVISEAKAAPAHPGALSSAFAAELKTFAGGHRRLY